MSKVINITTQTDDDTFFVFVEDTVSIGSYESDDKQLHISDKNNYISDDHKCEPILRADDYAMNLPYDDQLNREFMDEIMSAMEEEGTIDVILNEPSIKEINVKIKADLNINNFETLGDNILQSSEKSGEDTTSMSSCKSGKSDVSKSFVFVSPNHKCLASDTCTNSANGSVNDTCSLTKVHHNSSSDRTGDIISIDGLDMFEQPSMEYDDTWHICNRSIQGKTEKPEKIIMHELSFDDELIDVKGVDLMAPVFLAITSESEDHITDMKRKAKSIEDLCSVTLNEDGHRQRGRSRSDITFQQKLKSIKYIKAKQCANLNKLNSEDFQMCNTNDTDGRLYLTNPVIKSHISFDDLCLSSTSSRIFECNGNDFFEDPDVYIDSVYDNGYTSNDPSGDVISCTYPSDVEEENLLHTREAWGELKASEPTISVSSIEDEIILEANQHSPNQPHMFAYKDKNDLKRSPRCVPGSQCGFLEYPYGERSPLGSPHKVRRLLGVNTSPESPTQSGGLHDRIVVNVNGQQRIIDMQLIEPYLKVLSHGGHHRVGNENHDIVVFAACFLPEKTNEKYSVIMEQLFFYCIHAVDLLVHDSYEVVFFNSALESKNMPARRWIKQYYDMICYRLKKNLKNIYFVHQSLWLKAALRFSKLFVSSKFRRKIHLIRNIKSLKCYVPLEYIFVPPNISKVDETFQ